MQHQLFVNLVLMKRPTVVHEDMMGVECSTTRAAGLLPLKKNDLKCNQDKEIPDLPPSEATEVIEDFGS